MILIFSGKHGTPVSNGTAGRKRSTSTTLEGRKVKSSNKGSYTRLHSVAASDQAHNSISMEDKSLGKASSLIEVPTGSDNSESSTKSTIVRTESLVSDVLSFYSLDGDDNTSKVSLGLSSPKSFRSLSHSNSRKLSNASPTSTQYDTAPCSTVNSPTTSQFESMTSQTLTSPNTSQYETASMGRNSSSMSFDTPTLQPDSPVNLGALEEEDDFDDDDTISRAASSGSFISAVSEHEDLGLVNLHMQVNKPITDSPLLMSSYISHLTQLRCSHWNDSVAILSHELYSNKRYFTPDYDMLEEGFSVINMRDKIEAGKEEQQQSSKSDGSGDNISGFDWDSQTPESNERSEFVSSLSDSNTSKTTIIVKFKGSIDIICCPIVLESLEKTLNSLVKTFQGLHPISVVNHLHAQSVDRVESRNTLKKEKSLDLQEKLIVEARDSKVKDKDSAANLPSDTLRYTKRVIFSKESILTLKALLYFQDL